MIEAFRHTLEQFEKGVSLTPSEIMEVNQALRANRENDEAILGGYSVSTRKYQHPEIPSLFDRIRRGLRNVFSSDRSI